MLVLHIAGVLHWTHIPGRIISGYTLGSSLPGLSVEDCLKECEARIDECGSAEYDIPSDTCWLNTLSPFQYLPTPSSTYDLYMHCEMRTSNGEFVASSQSLVPVSYCIHKSETSAARHGLTHWGQGKWTPFCRRHFQAHFLEWKYLNFK